MRYEPYAEEYAAVPDMTDGQLLDYFLYRLFETEELWGIREGPQWFTREIDGHITQPIWPYKRYAEEATVDEWDYLMPVACSLEFFLYQALDKLVAQDVMLEIMPRKMAAGCLISPQRLFSILEGMIDSGEYTLDG